MEHKPLLRVAGPAWEIARYFLFIVFLAAAFSPSGSPDLQTAPWLLAAGAGGLVMPVAFLMLALVPERYAPYLPLLRLGKALEAATVVLLYATGAIAPDSLMPVLALRVPVLDRAPVAFGIILLADLAVLVALMGVRSASGPAGSPGAAGMRGSR